MTILSSVIVASDAAPCACTASPILAAAKLLLPTLERCERIDARHLRAALEVAFGATNTSGVWDWKTAYEACEVTTGMVRARFGKALLSEAATRATRLEYLGKITKLLSNLSSRGRTIIDLAEGLQLRRARVMRAHRIELTDFTEAMCERLRAYGLFAEIIPCKLRFFLPIDASGLTILVVRLISSCSHRRAGGSVMTPHDAADLSHRLGRQAEAVCRRYLDAGRRQGNYWQVGDVRNTPGRSMFVRLTDTAKGPAGKWQDAATGEHGDLLDIIRENLGRANFSDALEEARNFLRMPNADEAPTPRNRYSKPLPDRMLDAARRLFAISRPISGTLAETYLHKRGLSDLHETRSLRFHPRCFYRSNVHGPRETWPAMIAAVTTWEGRVTGVHRTWLAQDGSGKAPVDTPRKAMGDLLCHAVRFGMPGDVMAAGEGIESVLSVRQVLPNMAMAAALSAAHLAAMAFHPGLRRLYIICDNDPAGDGARDSLMDRAAETGIEALVLSPQLGDFNEDLRQFGIDALRVTIEGQLSPEDTARFMMLGT